MDKIINEDISYSLDVCRGGMRSCEAGRKEENLREVWQKQMLEIRWDRIK